MRAVFLIRVTYLIILALLAGVIWWQLYNAQFLAYDENYASLIFAFIISLFGTMAIIGAWSQKRNFLKQNALPTILFLFTSSPLTVVFVFYFYTSLFGHLKG